MGLVDYSESDSGSEAETPAPIKAHPKPTPSTSKKPFQKVVDRSNPGKIVVSLPQATSASDAQPAGGEPPAKRARTGAGGRFSGFNSFLPAPKNPNQPKPAAGTSSKPAVNFKTSAAPGFSRDAGGGGGSSSGGLSFSPPKAQPQPSIPEGQKPEEEVELVGKPLMFKPLSVARNPAKKKKAAKAAATKAATSASQRQTHPDPETPSAPAPPPKASLFSMHTEELAEPGSSSKPSGTYEPLFATERSADEQALSDYAQYASSVQAGPSATTAPASESLDTIADDMNLSAAARRELFGRPGAGNQSSQRVINFNMDKEYDHNEVLRQAGEQELHNPVRAIQTGKHSLRQLVQNVSNQREALEDSFAKGKTTRKEASSRYGW
ncbi:hypothetical protein G7046_g3825 [Stylonectria norvegica]|nr:hypothetical protein G7046_g3825 [Stylonectria norvegica]